MADRIVAALAGCGVRHIFGMPGSHTTTVYDAIGRHGALRTVLVRNEQAAAFAADGYSRVTGRPGVVCTTAGPGATNALTGMAEAWADSVPVILLTGQVNADRMHQECGAYHEIDLESILRPVTLSCATVRQATGAVDLVRQTWRAVTTGRPRPAALILPQDVMRHPAAEESATPQPEATDPATPDAQGLSRAAAVLNNAARPVILAGGGALWSGAGDEVRALAERLQAPVVTSLNGKGLLDERDTFSLGHARSARARVALPHADAMLALGCRFTEVMTGWGSMPVPPALVQVDLDANQIGMNHPVQVGLQADVRATLQALLPLIRPGDVGGWSGHWDEARTARPEAPEWFIDTLRVALPGDVPVFTDACEMGYRMQTDWPSYGPRRFFYPSNYITLGWGFPAAIGAAVAREGGAVVSVSGDGGFLMASQELATAARYKLRLIAIVHNDSTYGAIKNIQRRDHAERYLDVDLYNPDFLQLAEAYGVAAARATDPGSLSDAVAAALDRDGPTLIEVPDRWRLLRPVRR